MYIVGVDGGTTKTIALVADEQGRIVAAARGQGSNWTGEEVDIPMAVVVDTVRAALAQAGLPDGAAKLGVFCLAGADWPEDLQRREEYLRRAGIVQQVKVKNDAFGGLRAGVTRPYGIVLAAGTGMNAAAIAPDGREWAFGYYETFGGAGSLAKDAFEAALREEDRRGPSTVLTSQLLAHLGYPDVEAMLRAWLRQSVDLGRFYSFVPRVFQAALEGDPVATALIIRQGKGLAEYATALARRFDMCAMEFDVVLAGSIFKGAGPLLIDTITQEIHQAAPLAHVVRARFEPAVGSVLLAYDALGISTTDAIYAQLMRTTPDAGLFDTSRCSSSSSIQSNGE